VLLSAVWGDDKSGKAEPRSRGNPLSRDGALRRTILIVDDDRDIREVTADALEAEGYHTATAGAALAWLRVHHSQPRIA